MGKLFAALVCAILTLSLGAMDADARGRGGGGGRSHSHGGKSTAHKSSKSSSIGYGTVRESAADTIPAAQRSAQAPAAPAESTIQQQYNAALKEACLAARPGAKLPAACQALR